MRVMCAFCALVVIVLGVPAMAVAQHDSGAAVARDPALPPSTPLPPLYFPREIPGRVPAPDARIRELAREGVDGRPLLLVSQRQPEDEFKPISELPPEEKLPAAPMLVAAYVFVVLALSAYVLSIARRLNAVGREIAKLESQIKRH